MNQLTVEIPYGMTEVDKDVFYKTLYSDRRDIMPNCEQKHFVDWRTNDGQRILFGWSVPGYASPSGTAPRYAIVSELVKRK